MRMNEKLEKTMKNILKHAPTVKMPDVLIVDTKLLEKILIKILQHVATWIPCGFCPVDVRELVKKVIKDTIIEVVQGASKGGVNE